MPNPGELLHAEDCGAMDVARQARLLVEPKMTRSAACHLDRQGLSLTFQLL